MEKKQMELKHRDKETTSDQDAIISGIQSQQKISYLEAKELYFNNPETYTKNVLAELSDPATASPLKPKRAPLTVDQAKLGVTLVLNKDDCAKLGISGDTTCKAAIKVVRAKLGVN